MPAATASTRSYVAVAEEVVAGERPEHDVVPGANGCGARDVAEERDLPDERRSLLDLDAVGQVDLERPPLEDVERVAGVAAGEERRAGGQLDPLQPARQVLDRLQRQDREERHGPQRRDLLERNVGAVVDCREPASRRNREEREDRSHDEKRAAGSDQADERRRRQRAHRQ
jgi:hypothetical protein